MKTKNPENRRVIDEKTLSIDEWLNLIAPHPDDRSYIVADYQFPSDEIRDQYLESIQSRPESEIKLLLRKFLIQSGSFGQDRFIIDGWLLDGKLAAQSFEKYEFAKRFFGDNGPWEGNTWILDLLPESPEDAIRVIEAYFTAHIQFLPDGKAMGLSDAKAVIRAKYLNTSHPIDAISSLSSRDFEFLISALFRKHGYETSVTKASNDGGFDVLGLRNSSGSKEKVLIECKLHKNRIGVKTVRELSGVIESHRANRGIIVATGDFTSYAKAFADENRIELIDWDNLNRLLNRHLGTNWIHRMDFYIDGERRNNSKIPKE